MVSNDLVVPLVLKRRETFITERGDVGALLLKVRRVAIFVILLFAYLYYRSAGDAQLASIGLLSFAAVAQLAPAFFGGLIWRRGTARGALAGMTAGILVWAYTLLLPSFVEAGLFNHAMLTEGPFGLSFLRPQALLGLDLPPLVHGVVWSLSSQYPRLCRVVVRTRAIVDRAIAGGSFRPSRSCADEPELSPVAILGHDRRPDHDRLPLSRRGTHPDLVRKLRIGASG